MTKSLRIKSIIGFLLISLIVSFSFTSCEKYSSPRKINRLLTQGSWVLSSAFIDNIDMTSSYTDYQFNFLEDGTITIIGDSTVSGIWDAGIEKNPAIISITITPFLPFYHMNADWTVTTCSKDRMILELNGALAVDILILDKVASI